MDFKSLTKQFRIVSTLKKFKLTSKDISIPNKFGITLKSFHQKKKSNVKMAVSVLVLNLVLNILQQKSNALFQEQRHAYKIS